MILLAFTSIIKFYININHGILKSIVRHKIKDIKVLETLDEIIDSVDTRKKNLALLYRMREMGSACKDVPREIQKLKDAEARDDTGAGTGFPIGNYTSQWLGNLCLNEVDTFSKQNLRAKAYIMLP